MNIINIIREEIQDLEYRGDHTAPNKNHSPIYDVSDSYGEDMYGGNAMRYYGNGNSYDRESIGIIQSLRNKPNRGVKIYRAVPDINNELDKEIKYYYELAQYVRKFGFAPIKDRQASDIHSSLGYNATATLDYLNDKIRELNQKKQKPIGINSGDWVTISLAYARDHGRSHLKNKFKVVTKTVPARTLFTDGNDVNEWGYDPT